ncbi:MAG: Fic family protein [Deltaproteobacteria bacterium]|nr:Fic family protein [Deltaproteobacteria bacterium]
MDRYRHISFRKEWEIRLECAYMLGECDAYINALTDIPLKPADRTRLLTVSLIKGAQATTAIEGNTLTDEEIEKVQEGWKLPPSKEYQEIEVRNIINAFNELLHEIAQEGREQLITPELVKRFHRMIGKDLGSHFDAIPGKFRDDSRVVGRYLAPDHRSVPDLMSQLCKWLREEFHYDKGQKLPDAVIQAIITHVYIEWIHPFGDGNGRTGRLLEFYILLRAGLPSIVSHILSNFYNQTRQEYYRQFDNARNKRDLTEFIEYAVRGFKDGLKEALKVIQDGQFIIFWHNYIHETFADLKYTKREVFKRKRELMLGMPINKGFDVDEITLITPQIAKKYATLNRATILRDLKELQEINLIIKEGRKYTANIQLLKSMMPIKKAKDI